MITFAPTIACRYFSIELAAILHAVAAWSDVAGVAVAVLDIRELDRMTAPPEGAHVAVNLQTASCLARDRRGLAQYLKHALRPDYSIRTLGRIVRVEWAPAPYVSH